MKTFPSVLVLSIALFSPTAHAAKHTRPAPLPAPAEKALVLELSIPAPLPEIWKAFTTQAGLQTWLGPECTVDLRPGGDWLVHFPGSNGGGTIVSFVPEKELVISALAPDKFPHVRAARTHAIFTFKAVDDTTVVRLTQTGWQSGAEWDRAYEYLLAGNGQLLGTLHRRFADGPLDWGKEFGLHAKPAAPTSTPEGTHP